MANTPLKNRKLSPWVTGGLEHRRWVEDRLHPLPELTLPRYSDYWMDEVWTRDICRACREVAEHRFIELMRRIERNRIIDKMLREANADAEARHAARQAAIDKLLKDAQR